MYLVNSIDIDDTDLNKNGDTRQINFSIEKEIIEGEDVLDSSFKTLNLQVFDNSSPAKFYDFVNNVFTTGEINQSTKVKKINPIETEPISIIFPASTSAVYTVYAYTTPDSNIKIIDENASSEHVFKLNISQINDTTLTLTPATSNSSTYKTFTSVTRTADQTADFELKSFRFVIENVETDANGFGIVPTLDDREQINFINSNFYFEKTHTVNGTTSSSTQVILDDISDLIGGMVIVGVSSGSLTGTPAIVNIGGEADDVTDIVNPNIITLSSAQSFADGITLTFRAIGARKINDAIGCAIGFRNLVATPTKLTKTVRSDIASSTTITLNGTYGVAKGASFVGLDVDNSSTNTVQSVSASSSAGSMVCQVNQTLSQSSTLSFKGCNRIITLTGDLVIDKQPNIDRTININIDDFLTPGVGS